MNIGLKEINEIIAVCESLEQYIFMNGTVETGDASYEKYKKLIDRFDDTYSLQTHSSAEVKYLRGKLCKLYWKDKYTVCLEEARDIKSLIIKLKHVLFPDYYEKIFISHREMDKEQVHAFIELLYAIGIPRPLQGEGNPIFCSSHPAAYIENGCPISDEIKKQFNGHEHRLYIIWYTENFFDSQACLNEAGAIWAMNKKYQEILYPNMDRQRIQGLLDKQPVSFYSNDAMRLNTFKEQIEKLFDISPINLNYWEMARNAFIAKMNEIYEREHHK